jgi:hypothetical protein
MTSTIERLPKINGTIIESSLIFITIFATVGLLFGGITQQFKTTYFYFGYMLYYSLPFIFAAFLSTVSMIRYYSRRERARYEAGIVTFLAVCFFFTGFMMLVLLASSATQTVMLPSQFLFLTTYQSLSSLELVAFVILASISFLIFLAASGRNKRWRLWALALSLVIFVSAIFTMTMFGVRQMSYIAASGSMILEGAPDYEIVSVPLDLIQADQIYVEMKVSDGNSFSYAFLDTKNHALYANITTRSEAQIIKYGFGSDLNFQAVVEFSAVHYLSMKSEFFLGTNVTYSVTTYRTDTIVLGYAFIAAGISGACFLGIMMADTGETVDASKRSSKKNQSVASAT